MDRRGFIKTTGTLIAGATFVPGAFSAERNAPTDTSGRMELPMNRGWLYSRTAEQAATARDFNDAQFERVVVPHTNVKLPWHGFTEQDYAFISTYRRHFKLPQPAAGKRVFVDFEGVMTASTVWINGQKLGEYKGVGFTMGRARADGENDVVSTTVERPNNPPTAVDWVIADVNAKPRIIDVVAEGTSLRLTQRQDYASYLLHNNNNVDALISAMKNQVAQNG